MMMRWILVFMSILCFSTQSQALSETQKSRAQVLYSQLRCVVCEGQSLAESDAAIAVDMRHYINGKIVSGDSNAEIIESLIDSYGQTILMSPPVEGEHLIIWFLPFMLLFLGLFFLYRNLRRGHRE